MFLHISEPPEQYKQSLDFKRLYNIGIYEANAEMYQMCISFLLCIYDIYVIYVRSLQIFYT